MNELSKESNKDLSPEDREFLENIKKDHEEFLERLKELRWNEWKK